MILKDFKQNQQPTLQMPPRWWHLPFASALMLHGVVARQCQLCHYHVCSSLPITEIKKGCNPHWFNRLQYLCEACHQSIDWTNAHYTLTELPFNKANQVDNTLEGRASSFYQFPYDSVMLRYKNAQQLDALMPLIHAIRQLDKPQGCHAHNSVIIPIPTSDKRLKNRGFAPVWLLAQFLSFHWQIPLFSGVARYERQHQQGLTRDERLENVKKAFYFTDTPTAKHLILFDDVVTTGATYHAIIDALFSLSNHDISTMKYTLHAVSLLHGHA